MTCRPAGILASGAESRNVRRLSFVPARCHVCGLSTFLSDAPTGLPSGFLAVPLSAALSCAPSARPAFSYAFLRSFSPSALQAFSHAFLRSCQTAGSVGFMQTVVLAAQKGGVGKTTLTVSLAVRAVFAGKRTAIIDADPQASASNWFLARRQLSGLDGPPVAPAPDLATLKAAVEAAREDELDYCFIDTPAGASEIPTEAGKLADLILIPCAPSRFDMEAMTPTVKMVRRLQKPSWFLINQGRSKGINDDCALALTSAFGLPAVNAHISARMPIVDAAQKGLTVIDLPPKQGIDQAKAEFTALWDWIERQAGLPLAPPPSQLHELRS
jgi:chromosome partitioning protein